MNLLVAGYNSPQEYGGGSGIYAGTQGPLVVLMPQQASTKLLIATVPKKAFQESESSEHKNIKNISLILPKDEHISGASNEMKFLQDKTVSSATIQPLGTNLSFRGDGVAQNQLSYSSNGFSCNVEVNWRNNAGEKNHNNYKMIAYSGDRNFSTVSRNHIEVCGLIWCDQEKPDSACLLPDFDIKNSSVEMRSVKISAKSYNSVISIPIPSTMSSSMYPLDVSKFTFHSSVMKDEDNQEFYSIEMILKEPVIDLMTFAVYKLPSDPASDHKMR